MVCHVSAEATSLSGAERSDATRRTTSAASSRCGAMTMGVPLLMMPAFSAAINGSVLPRVATWSRLTGVITLTSGSTTFVESSLPPSPTSTTWKSTPLSRKCSKAMAVIISKKLIGPCCPSLSTQRT